MITLGKSILIIHNEGNTFNNPSLKSIIDLLLEEKYKVVLRFRDGKNLEKKYKKLKFSSYPDYIGRIKRFFYNKLVSKVFIDLCSFLEFLYVLMSIGINDYKLILAIDREGIIESRYWNIFFNTPVIFISYEILFEDETSKEFKMIEKKSSKFISKWIIQDKQRSFLLSRENNLPEKNRFILPISSSNKIIKARYRMRDKLKIQKDKKVAILMGSLSEWSMAEDVINSVNYWPNDWCLMIHERYGKTHDFLNKISNGNLPKIGEKLFISNQPEKYVDSLDSLLSGVSMGFAFYKPNSRSIYTGKNLAYIGMASGKISTFLRGGIPVIMNEIGEIAKQAKLNGFGYVVNHPKEISNLLSCTDCEKMSLMAKKYYEKNISFDLYKNPLKKLFEDEMKKINNKK